MFDLTVFLTGCTLSRQDVRLTLHYEKGFTITREPADQTGGAVLFRYPYEKLKMSADDGIRNLYLDFGGPEGEMVSYININSSPDLFQCSTPIKRRTWNLCFKVEQKILTCKI